MTHEGGHEGVTAVVTLVPYLIRAGGDAQGERNHIMSPTLSRRPAAAGLALRKVDESRHQQS